MPDEQEATLKALETALQMEIDGKEFYLKASKASTNKLGKDLLKKLAVEEDIHRNVFENIYNHIKDKKGWPDVKYHGDGGHGQDHSLLAGPSGNEIGGRAWKARVQALLF